MKREEDKRLASVTRAKILGRHAQSIPGRNPSLEQVKDEAAPRRLDRTGLAVVLRDNDGAELIETGLVGLVEGFRLYRQAIVAETILLPGVDSLFGADCHNGQSARRWMIHRPQERSRR